MTCNNIVKAAKKNGFNIIMKSCPEHTTLGIGTMNKDNIALSNLEDLIYKRSLSGHPVVTQSSLGGHKFIFSLNIYLV